MIITYIIIHLRISLNVKEEEHSIDKFLKKAKVSLTTRQNKQDFILRSKFCNRVRPILLYMSLILKYASRLRQLSSLM